MASFFRRHKLLTFATATSLPLGYGAYKLSTSLTSAYPRTSPPSDSSLRRPVGPFTVISNRSLAVFTARIPASLLPSDSPAAAWTRAFLATPTMRFKGNVFGGFKDGSGDTGKMGLEKGQELLNGVFNVCETPAEESQQVVVQWRMPEHVVDFFDKAANLFWPWRLMSGGKHTFEATKINDEECEVRFGCGHSYLQHDDGKEIPEWSQELHLLYARWLFDEGVRQLKRDARLRSRGGLQVTRVEEQLA